MEYGQISGIAKPISRVVQGTAMFSEDARDAAFALLDAALAASGTTFDTGHIYMHGGCERVFGAWARDRGVRDQITLIDKGAHPTDQKNPRVTPEDIALDLRESLEDLGFDFIDIYLLHRDDPAYPVGPIMEALNEHQAAGKIGIFGGSNWSVQRLEEANEYAYAHNLNPFTVSSPNFSLATQHQAPWAGCLSIAGETGSADRAWYAAHNMPLITWSSLAGGFFSGRFRRDNLDSFSTYGDKLCVETYSGEANFARLDRAEQLGRERGMTLPQVALAYVLSQPLNIYALVGSATPAEYQMNADALALKLTADELAWLESGTPTPA